MLRILLSEASFNEDLPPGPPPTYYHASKGRVTPRLVDPNEPPPYFEGSLREPAEQIQGLQTEDDPTPPTQFRERETPQSGEKLSKLRANPAGRWKQILKVLKTQNVFDDPKDLPEDEDELSPDDLYAAIGKVQIRTESADLVAPYTPDAGWTFLLVAAYEGLEDVTRFLVQAGADIKATTPEGNTALILAVQKQHLGLAKLLLGAGADTTWRNERGQTALLIASGRGDEEIVVALLDASRDPGADSRCSNNTLSCLHVAAWAGHLENVKHLVAARAPQGGVDEVEAKAGWTPLLTALRQNHVEVARFLLLAGADPNIGSTINWTALHMACYYITDEDLFKMIAARVRKTTRSSATQKGSTPLSLAAEKGFVAAVRVLITKYGVDTLVRNDLFCTPLYYAAYCGSPEAVEILMEADYLADVQSNWGWTALHAACRNCTGETVKKLAAVTNWISRQRSGMTPLQIAIGNENDAACFALLKAGIPPDFVSASGTTPLLEAAIGGNEEIVNHLLARGAKLDSFNWGYYLPINGGYKSRNPSLIEKLRPSDHVIARASINSLDCLIHEAAKISLAEVKWTINRGMRTFSRNAHHYTPLSVSCQNGHADIVDFVLEQRNSKFPVEIPCFLTSWTPIHIASRLRQTECLEILARKSAVDPLAEDCFGLTAFDYFLGNRLIQEVLANAYPPVAENTSYDPGSHRQRQVDIHQICNIMSWRIERLKLSNNQFGDSDSKIASLALIDPLFRLSDEKNGLTAIENYLGQPSLHLDANIVCNQCHRRKNKTVFACKICPFRLLCRECAAESHLENTTDGDVHETLELPTKSWFARDTRYVNDDEENEMEWLQSALKKYKQEKDSGFDISTVPRLNVEYESVRADPFTLIENSDASVLVEHLHEYPRDIALRRNDGRTIVMKCLEIAKSDDSCLEYLHTLARHGARLLGFDNNKISTIQLACEKNFEKSLAFILEQWDPDFDRVLDPYSSNALQKMIENGWQKALKFAIERHFDWAARDRFFHLHQLPIIGLTDETIVNILTTSTLASEYTSSTSNDEDFWAVFDQPPHQTEPQVGFHDSGCIHEILGTQRTLIGDEIPPRSESSKEIQLRDRSSDDSDQSAKGKAPINRGSERNVQLGDDMDAELDAEEDTDDDTEDDSDEQLESMWFDSGTVGAAEAAIALCGLGGLFSDGHTTPSYSPMLKGTREVSISYRTGIVDENCDLRKSLDVLANAGAALLEAIGRAQKAGLCCSAFTILHATQRWSEDGHPVVRLSQVPVDLVVPFVNEVRSTSKEQGKDMPTTSLQACVVLAEPILKCFNVEFKMGQNSEEVVLHRCSLAMQLLCLGFVSFLGAHLSHFQIPIITARISKFSLLGIETDVSATLSSQKMACIGKMLRDELLVFSTGSAVNGPVVESSLAEDAYLLARTDDILELWGPPTCFGEEDDLGNATGNLLAVHLQQGQLLVTGRLDRSNKVAHWSSEWQDISQLSPFSATEELLVGVLRTSPCEFNMAKAWDRANYGTLRQLDTREDFWKITSRQISLSFTQSCITANIVLVQDRIRGFTKKRSVVTQWESPVGYLEVLNQPWGAILSICTGFAKRVPLRMALAEVLDQYLERLHIGELGGHRLPNDWLSIRTTLRAKLAGESNLSTRRANAEFKRYLNETVTKDYWPFVKAAVIYVLQHLEQTGIDESGKKFRVAWADARNPLKCFEFSCTKREFYWLRLMKDSSAVATFAVATERCLIAHHDDSVPYGKNTSCRSHLHSRRDPDPTEFRLLQTTVLPCSLKNIKIEDWRLHANVWYIFRPPKGSDIFCKLGYLGTDSRRLAKFLIAFRLKDFLRHPTDVARTTTMEREYLQEEHEAHRSTSRGRVLVSTLADWMRREPSG